MTNELSDDFDRRALDFKTDKVVEVLPEHFRSDHSKFIQVLEAYKDFMDSDGGFNGDLSQIIRSRDVNGIALEFMDFLLSEIANGLRSDQVSDPREIAKVMPDFFKYKGTIFSAKLFFRALYEEEAEILYPKDNLFIVGESRIGAESLKYIQDGALYQVLSVLVKSSRSITEWRDLYKQFVHPAGFYLGGEVIVEGKYNFDLSIMPDGIIDSAAGEITLSSTAISLMSAEAEHTGLLADSNGDETRIDLSRDLQFYQSDSAELLDDQYGKMINMMAMNTVGFSDSHDSPGIDFSNNIETMDRSVFDSANENTL